MNIQSRGGSGAEFQLRLRKVCKNAINQVDWINTALRNDIPTVKIYNIDSDYYEMEYLDPHEWINCSEDKAWDSLDFDDILNIIIKIKNIKTKSYDVYNFQTYLNRIFDHIYESTKYDSVIHLYHFMNVPKIDFDEYLSELKKYENYYNSEISFCHGDLTLENIMFDGYDKIKIIDPNRPESLWSSWLLDISKLYQSIHLGYEDIFKNRSIYENDFNVVFKLFDDRKDLLKIIEKKLKYNINAVLLLEISHYIRMIKYKQMKSDRIKVICIIDLLWMEYLNGKN